MWCIITKCASLRPRQISLKEVAPWGNLTVNQLPESDQLLNPKFYCWKNARGNLNTSLWDKVPTYPGWRGGGGVQSFLNEDAQSRLQNFDLKILTSIPQKAQYCDLSLYQIAAPNTQFASNWALFWPYFPKSTQFCKLGTLGLEWKPTHRYTKTDEKAPLSL